MKKYFQFLISDPCNMSTFLCAIALGFGIAFACVAGTPIKIFAFLIGILFLWIIHREYNGIKKDKSERGW